ncbi:MAG: hemerythrin domain-containing protein [Dokdonella sp.]
MTKATASPSRRSSPQSALDVLKADHDEVSGLFKKFKKADDSDGMQEVAQATCKALSVHAQIEEEIFYPALREAADAEDALDEADVEHSHIKELVAQLKQAEPGDDKFEARYKVLSEYVQHHVEEEESTLFSRARKSGVDLVAIGERLIVRKQALGADDAPVGNAVVASRARKVTKRPAAGSSR